MKKKKITYNKNERGSFKSEIGLRFLLLLAPIVLLLSVFLYKEHKSIALFVECLAVVFLMSAPYFIRAHRNKDKTKQWIDSREDRAGQEQNEFYYGTPENKAVSKEYNKKRRYLNVRYSEERVTKQKLNDAKNAVIAIGLFLCFAGYVKSDIRFYMVGAAILIAGLLAVNIILFRTLHGKSYTIDELEEYNQQNNQLGSQNRYAAKDGKRCPVCSDCIESGMCIRCGYRI